MGCRKVIGHWSMVIGEVIGQGECHWSMVIGHWGSHWSGGMVIGQWSLGKSLVMGNVIGQWSLVISHCSQLSHWFIGL